MINTNCENIKLLINEELFSDAIYLASKKIYLLCKSISNEYNRNDNFSLIYKNINSDTLIYFKEIDVNKINKILIKMLFRDGNSNDIDTINFLQTNVDKRVFNKITQPMLTLGAIRNFFKLVLIQLWIDKVILLPKKFMSPQGVYEIFDKLCLLSGSNNLKNIRSLNSSSTISSADLVNPADDRDRRATQWIRLLLTTDLYNTDDIDKQCIIDILENGCGKKPLYIGMYPKEFLLQLAFNNSKLLDSISIYINEFVDNKIKLQKEERHILYIKKERAVNSQKKQCKSKFITKIQLCADYINENTVPAENLNELFKILKPAHLRRIANTNNLLKFTNEIKVLNFINTLNKIFLCWVESLRLQGSQNHLFTISLLISYLVFYLIKYNINNYGNTDNYPSNLNEFNCSYFVTRDRLLTELLLKDKSPPITLIEYINLYSKHNDWVAETLYTRILIIDNFFTWIAENSSELPDSKEFKNTFSDSNYPRLSRKLGTNKNPIPAKYYSTLINLLYTLEYLVMHINDMAIGINAGIVKGELYFPTINELEEHSHWSNLWGKTGAYNRGEIDLSIINYTPIILHDGKYYPLTTIYRFYSISKYKYNGQNQTRALPNDIRLELLMSETGIRSAHLAWLDLNRFDSFIDDSNRNELEPLLVNTDKRHPEWIATVRDQVINICRRQKDFYLTNEDPEFKQKIWYQNSEGSKFGQFKPLFRITANSVSKKDEFSWPLVLLTLQQFIKNILKDNKLPDLVKYVKVNTESSKALDFDEFGISVSDFIKEDHDDAYSLRARSTRHALRATFVTDKLKYLPASIIGKNLTGQSERLVYYYNVVDINEQIDHKELLSRKIAGGFLKNDKEIAPEISARAVEINKSLLHDIKHDPALAISKYGLMSLSNYTEDDTGIEILKAKKYTGLAFNDTHICPFKNTCPSEIIKDFGRNRPCSQCPYAIRSAYHLPAISSAKDQAYELMNELKNKIKIHTSRPEKEQNKYEIEKLRQEFDISSYDAFSLEFTEKQLYELHKNGQSDSYLANNPEALKLHFERIPVSEAEYVIKRLIDITNFPTMDSATIQARFAYMNLKLLAIEGNIVDSKNSSDQPENVRLLSHIKSIIQAQNLSLAEIYKLAKTDIGSYIFVNPELATKEINFKLSSAENA